MSTFVLPLTDLNATLENVGGKGMSLAKMARAGLPVPDGFHVTTDAYRLFVNTNVIWPRILDVLNGETLADSLNAAHLEDISRRIRQYFDDGEIPPEIARAVDTAYHALSNLEAVGVLAALVPVAVRSSATAEDLPGASFAGQQETYLNTCGTGAVLKAVQKCWSSLWTARAIVYRAQHSIDLSSVALAVVVQKLIFADASGVLFTTNPVNGKRDEIVINAAWGLGNAIVSGAVTRYRIVRRKK